MMVGYTSLMNPTRIKHYKSSNNCESIWDRGNIPIPGSTSRYVEDFIAASDDNQRLLERGYGEPSPSPSPTGHWRGPDSAPGGAWPRDAAGDAGVAQYRRLRRLSSQPLFRLLRADPQCLPGGALHDLLAADLMLEEKYGGASGEHPAEELRRDGRESEQQERDRELERGRAGCAEPGGEQAAAVARQPTTERVAPWLRLALKILPRPLLRGSLGCCVHYAVIIGVVMVLWPFGIM